MPGDTGEYEWAGFRAAKDLPFSFNPREHFIATANHNILPPGYNVPLGYEWALPFRFEQNKGDVICRVGSSPLRISNECSRT